MIWKPIYDSRLNTRVVTVNCSLETNAVIYVALFFLRSLYRVSQNSEKKNLVNPWLTPEPKASPDFSLVSEKDLEEELFLSIPF